MCAPILVRFFLADQRGIVCFYKNARCERPQCDCGKYNERPKNRNVQILTNVGEKVVE